MAPSSSSRRDSLKMVYVLSASETKKNRDRLVTKPRQLWFHCSLVPAEVAWAGLSAKPRCPVSRFPVACGTWSFFGVIRFLLSKDTASQQARAEVKRAKALVFILPKGLRL